MIVTPTQQREQRERLKLESSHRIKHKKFSLHCRDGLESPPPFRLSWKLQQQYKTLQQSERWFLFRCFASPSPSFILSSHRDSTQNDSHNNKKHLYTYMREENYQIPPGSCTRTNQNDYRMSFFFYLCELFFLFFVLFFSLLLVAHHSSNALK